jgi:hypothetical protein
MKEHTITYTRSDMPGYTGRATKWARDERGAIEAAFKKRADKNNQVHCKGVTYTIKEIK